MDALVSTAWLDAHRAQPDLRILDATLFLPEHGRDAAGEFVAGHIPGAGFLDLATLRDADSRLPNMRPTADDYAARMRMAGVGDDTRVVLYDDSPLRSAARAWWLLRHFGHARTAILDGGLAKWRAERRPLETGRWGGQATAPFSVREDAATLADKAAVTAALATGGAVVDARGVARFTGSEPEPHPGIAPGHMPGARNLPYARLFGPDGTWLRGDALRAAFAEAGIDPDAPFIATCGSGVTAAVLVFGAHLLGNDRVRLYDGSWAEWGGDPATPKATGPAA